MRDEFRRCASNKFRKNEKIKKTRTRLSLDRIEVKVIFAGVKQLKQSRKKSQKKNPRLWIPRILPGQTTNAFTSRLGVTTNCLFSTEAPKSAIRLPLNYYWVVMFLSAFKILWRIQKIGTKLNKMGSENQAPISAIRLPVIPVRFCAESLSI